MDFKIDLDELRKRKLFITTPMYGGVCEGSYMKSMLELGVLLTKHNLDFQFHCLFNESLITRARAYSCDEFMRSDCTHMLFVDSDVGFNPRDVLVLLWLQSKESEFDVIGGAYAKKCISWEKIKMAVDKGFAEENPNNLAHFVGDFVFNPKAGVGSFKIDEPVEVSELGTGFMMIRRETLDKYKAAYPELSYRPDHVRSEHFDGTREIHMYFDTAIDPDSKRYLSEDYKFCYDVQKMGGKVWLCPWMGLSHSGKYVFGDVATPGLSAMAALGSSPTADPDALKGTKCQPAKPAQVGLPGLPGAQPKEKFSDRIAKGK
jgi:hypothetical protein